MAIFKRLQESPFVSSLYLLTLLYETVREHLCNQHFLFTHSRSGKYIVVRESSFPYLRKLIYLCMVVYFLGRASFHPSLTPSASIGIFWPWRILTCYDHMRIIAAAIVGVTQTFAAMPEEQRMHRVFKRKLCVSPQLLPCMTDSNSSSKGTSVYIVIGIGWQFSERLIAAQCWRRRGCKVLKFLEKVIFFLNTLYLKS